VLAYLLAIRHGGSFFGGPGAGVQARYGVVPDELTGSNASLGTVFTSLFLQASFLQLLAAMLFLAIFGPSVEDALGRAGFLALYLLGGLLVLGVRVLADPTSTTPMLGAAGAVTAILAAYIVLHPRARVISLVFVVFFFTIVEVPAVILLIVWLAVQLCFSLTGPAFA
jgi:membrane associated rhomboid family serine protease